MISRTPLKGEMHLLSSSRRRFLQWLAVIGAGLTVAPGSVASPRHEAILKSIPSTGEHLPVIGMGSWQTFDVFDDRFAHASRLKVLQAFFENGGGMIDSSPMYGSSEKMIGYCLERIENSSTLFAATKVWTMGKQFGIRQMEKSRGFWGIERFDLMQIHNLLDWETHLETLKQWKIEGRIRYLGITTSHGRRHEEMEQIMKDEDLDFVQLTYNLTHREVEQRLLPLAAERGIAVIANRPFDGGYLFRQVGRRPLPEWAAQFDCENWAQLFLKFVVSHPAVTCAIPATSKVEHMVENMGAGFGRLPDAELRNRMIREIVL